MTNEDKKDCLTLLKEMKELCGVFSKHKVDDRAIISFVHAMDKSTDVLIEIIENKPLKIERMFL